VSLSEQLAVLNAPSTAIVAYIIAVGAVVTDPPVLSWSFLDVFMSKAAKLRIL
jgi:hypothetical protein